MSAKYHIREASPQRSSVSSHNCDGKSLTQLGRLPTLTYETSTNLFEKTKCGWGPCPHCFKSDQLKNTGFSNISVLDSLALICHIRAGPCFQWTGLQVGVGEGVYDGIRDQAAPILPRKEDWFLFNLLVLLESCAPYRISSWPAMRTPSGSTSSVMIHQSPVWRRRMRYPSYSYDSTPLRIRIRSAFTSNVWFSNVFSCHRNLRSRKGEIRGESALWVVDL